MRGRVLTRSLQWDESNLTLNEEERELAGARMTIDEPKTPFVHSAPAPPMEEERTWCAADAAFDLDHDEEPPTSLDSDKVQANTQANAAISASYQQLKEQLAASSAAPAPVTPAPISTISPSDMNTTRSAARRAKPISCVTTTIVMPASAREIMTSSTSVIISGSSADVGSSNSITLGSIARLRAIATRCCWPPESCAGRR